MDMRRTRSAVERYSEDDPQKASVLSFFSKIWEAQEEIASRLPISENRVEKDAAGDALVTHQPLFMLSSPNISLEAFIEATGVIAKIISESAGLGEEASVAIDTADFPGVIDQKLMDGLINDVDGFTATVAEKLGASAEGPLTLVTVDFILSTTLTAFLEGPSASIIASLEDVDWKVWNSGDCPICGTPASNSRVLDEGELQGGQRILSCPLCRAEWDYQRIRCARCGNRSHDSLHYLFDERDPGHRIHVCESCHGYIKVSVERDLDVSVVPQVEDVVTLALDDLAGSKGYSALGDEPSAEE